jgi:ribonucleoside-diphosphate reductase alpha chain
MDLGVLSTTDRMQPTLPGLEETYLGDAARVEREHFGDGGDSLDGPPRAGDTQAPATGSAMESRDAPFCYACGNVMQRAGSCYACPSCGATSGCS